VIAGEGTAIIRPPLGWVVERCLAPWLARQVRDEVVRLQQLLEAKP
jgi:hypothetical protein